MDPWVLSGSGYLAPPPRRLHRIEALAPLALGERIRLILGVSGGAGFTDATEVALLDHVFGKSTYTPPSNWFLALSTTTPTEAGGNFTEPSSGAYARVSTAPADWAAASGTAPAVTSNGNAIAFTTASGTWSSGSNMTHWGLFIASSAGTVRIWGALDTPRPVLSGDTPTAGVGLLRVMLGDPGDSYA